MNDELAEVEEVELDPLSGADAADWTEGRVIELVRFLRETREMPGSSPNRHAQKTQRLCAEEA